MKFKTVGPGEWQQPKEKGYLMQCCDCGLVHRMDFRIYRGRIQFRAFRNVESRISSTGIAVRPEKGGAN